MLDLWWYTACTNFDTQPNGVEHLDHEQYMLMSTKVYRALVQVLALICARVMASSVRDSSPHCFAAMLLCCLAAMLPHRIAATLHCYHATTLHHVALLPCCLCLAALLPCCLVALLLC